MISILEDVNLVDYVEDWSRVRSRSRAERRRRQGHRQNVVMRAVPKPDVYHIGNAFVMHPEIARRLRESVDTALSSFLRNTEAELFRVFGTPPVAQGTLTPSMVEDMIKMFDDDIVPGFQLKRYMSWPLTEKTKKPKPQ